MRSGSLGERAMERSLGGGGLAPDIPYILAPLHPIDKKVSSPLPYLLQYLTCEKHVYMFVRANHAVASCSTEESGWSQGSLFVLRWRSRQAHTHPPSRILGLKKKLGLYREARCGVCLCCSSLWADPIGTCVWAGPRLALGHVSVPQIEALLDGRSQPYSQPDGPNELNRGVVISRGQKLISCLNARRD